MRFLSALTFCLLPSLLGCGAQAPPAPSAQGLGLTRLEITCPGSELLGQRKSCFSRAFSTGGLGVGVSANWSSSDPAVATVSALGNFGAILTIGAGQTTIRATYGSLTAESLLTIRAEDFLEVSAADLQNVSMPGNTTLTVQGYYGIATADSGELKAEITDQNGKLIASSPPRVVSKGGSSYLVPTTFTIPTGTTKLCWLAVLKIGATTLTAFGAPDVTVPCFTLGGG